MQRDYPSRYAWLLRMTRLSGYARGTMRTPTQKMTRFVEELMSCMNASEAYRRAYSPAESSISVTHQAHELMKNPVVASMIAAKRAEIAERSKFALKDMLDRLFLVITCDPAELSSFKRGACRHCHGDDFRYQWREPDYWDAVREAEQVAQLMSGGLRKLPKGASPNLPDIAGGFGYNATRRPHPDCPKCDGRGIAHSYIPDTDDLSDAARAAYLGVKETRNGIEVMMMSKEKAIELYGRMAGWDALNLRLSAEAGLLSDAVKNATSDPNEAARQYRAMLDATT